MNLRNKFLTSLYLVLTITGLALPQHLSAKHHKDIFSWPSYGKDNNNSRFAENERMINIFNVQNLKVKWTFTTLDNRTTPPRPAAVAGNPSIMDDVMYFADDAGSVYALNAITGQLIWQRSDLIPCFPNPNPQPFPACPSVPADPCLDSPGIALTPTLGKKYVYVASANHWVFALNKKDGSTAWSKQIQGLDFNNLITSATTLIEEENLLIVPVGIISIGPLTPIPGYLIALNAKNGDEIWRFQTTLKPNNPGCPKGHSGCTDGGTGVGIFAGSPAVDTNKGLLFIGTGENIFVQGFPVPQITPIADSLLAFNYRTKNPNGKVKWFTQFVNDDIFGCSLVDCPSGQNKDWDASGGPYLLTIGSCNCKRDIVVIGTKEGKLFALDRKDGSIIWTTVLTNPSPQGSPLNGVNTFGCTDGETIFVPSHYSKSGLPISPFAPDAYNGDLTGTGIFAVRGSDGAQLWRVDFPGLTVGPLTLANGVVYHTTVLGTLRALDARNGRVLFTYQDDVSPVPAFNGLVGGTTVYKGMVYVPRGSGAIFFGSGFCVPGGIVALGF